MLVYLVTNSKTMDFGTNRIQPNPSRMRGNTLLDSGLNDFGKVISISAGIAFYNLSLKLQRFNSTMVRKYDLLSSILKYSASKRLFSTKIKQNIDRIIDCNVVNFFKRLMTQKNCLLFFSFVHSNNLQNSIIVENTIQYVTLFNSSVYSIFSEFIPLVGFIMYIFFYIYILTISRAVLTYINELCLRILSRGILVVLIIIIITETIILLQTWQNLVLSFIFAFLFFGSYAVLSSREIKSEIIPNQKSDGAGRLPPSQPNSDDDSSVLKKLKKKWDNLTSLQKIAIIATVGTGLYLIYFYFSGSSPPHRPPYVDVPPHEIKTTITTIVGTPQVTVKPVQFTAPNPLNLYEHDNLFHVDDESFQKIDTIRCNLIRIDKIPEDELCKQDVIRFIFESDGIPYNQKRLFTTNTDNVDPNLVNIIKGLRQWLSPDICPGDKEILTVLNKGNMVFGLDDIRDYRTLYVKHLVGYDPSVHLYRFSDKFYFN
jgi:hypothetical protein